tara:strand:- start:38 stop:574 length:537 start_codon:yes stop_codon:yes gene_type:complete
MDLSNKSIDKEADQYDELSNSQKLRDLIKTRNKDDINTVYNNDITEIYLHFNGEDIGLHLKDVSDTDPPIFRLDSVVDFKIECEEEDKYELLEEIVLCIRYEETIKMFPLGNIIEKTVKDNTLDYPRYIVPMAVYDELDITLDIYYDRVKNGLTHPVVNLYFSDNFWEEFKEYPQYLL